MENVQILIVDDDPVSLETLADLLVSDSYQVETATNGISLFHFLEHTLPDVILLDVMMPQLNGYEVCKRIKANPKWQHIPVVLITALNGRKSMLEGLEAGADDFLSKPVNGAELRVRVRNMARIKRQHDALQSTIQLQEDLVRLAVHDMRTPLATIFLHTGTLQLKDLPESSKWSLDVIKVEAQRLDRFVDELLLLIKLDQEKLRLNYSRVNLKQMISKAISDSNLLANAAEVTIEADFPNEEKAFSLDAGLLRRVVDNLLSHAIRQSPTGGKISVSLRYDDSVISQSDGQAGENGRQGIHLSVADQGRGIPEELRGNVFEMVEIINSRNRGITGPEIGLAFCKLVVDEHAGTISVKENQPRGSVFEVCL